MAEKYTEKEICVFNGIMTLCKEGKKIYNVTVQDIADAAGIGKGTLYEYFSSKEDIIIKAMVYLLLQENAQLSDIGRSDCSFRDKVYRVYDLVFHSLSDGFAMANRFVTGDDLLSLPQLLSDKKEEAMQVMEQRAQLLRDILGSGVREGVITLNFDRDYIRMAVVANLACIGQCAVPVCSADYSHIEQKKSVAYTLLLKSLNG